MLKNLPVTERFFQEDDLHWSVAIWKVYATGQKKLPMNFLSKQNLIGAQLVVVTGNNLLELLKYTLLILLFHEGCFVVHGTLENVRAGKYYLEQKDNMLALPFLHELYHLYETLEGSDKVRHLHE